MVPDIHREIQFGKVKSEVIDYFKVDALGFPINITISPRGIMGKTHNLKDFLIYKYYVENKSAIWLYNAKVQMEKDLPKWLASNKQANPAQWKDMIREHNIIKDKDRDKDDIFVYCDALSTSVRGSRDPRYAYIAYEEFNQSMDRIKKSQDWLFQNLIATTKNQINPTLGVQKVFLLANMDSVNIPLLAKWDILYIEQEHTFIYDDEGNPLIYIYCFIPTERDLKKIYERNKSDWTYQLAKKSGLEEFIFNNTSILDNYNHIIKWEEVEKWENKRLNVIYKINGQYISIWIIKGYVEGDQIYLAKYEKYPPKEGNIITLKVEDNQENINIAWNIELTILTLIVEGSFYYDSVLAKSILYEIF